MALVADTDVASFLFGHDTRAALYTPHLTGRTLTVSFQTSAEMNLWALPPAGARGASPAVTNDESHFAPVQGSTVIPERAP